jgi:hypothetical protein
MAEGTVSERMHAEQTDGGLGRHAPFAEADECCVSAFSGNSLNPTIT